MTNIIEGMPSYFWLTSTSLEKPLQDDVPYTTQALRQDLARVRNAWEDCQASRDRNAIYGYLSAVFDLVIWWTAEDRAIDRARWGLRLCRLDLPNDEPFAAIILCTLIVTRSTNERDPNGRACCGMQRSCKSRCSTPAPAARSMRPSQRLCVSGPMRFSSASTPF
jgi:hypothetical protein